ncbi:hypothetical protein C8A03DRAFT_31655 [Achaetomium macrosporum]|uniref:SWIM-type domain-containing protein n=1 Tax=Achaetomium macrosporum TaxID=79813 RepID=A0AAN7CFA9_9PEZI|nr:hypothetical protein C8A03DRAFT_31655 [Achaetomium macrosporum]
MQTSYSHRTNPPLPTSRALLTSLINSISNIPLLPVTETDSRPEISHRLVQSDHNNSNPLRRVPPFHRHLIITLHVLFPGMVLPALDLLERGFVCRMMSDHKDSKDGGVMKGGSTRVPGRQARAGDGHGEGHDASSSASAQAQVPTSAEGSPRGPGNAFYLVGSASAAAAAAQTSMRERRRRKRRAESAGEAEGVGDIGSGMAAAGKKGYVVRLEAWHCTCAAFAFAAVQGEAVRPSWEVEPLEFGAEVGDMGAETEAEPEWSFGGMSLDGLEAGEGVPVCKHLLACLLAERWSAALGRYVIERRAEREEIAGIVADV